jgi:hypothetical protein
MARSAEIKINWEAVEKRVYQKVYEKDSPADAKNPHKAGDKVDRIKIENLDDVNQVFAGDMKGCFRILASALSARWDARKADPDAKIKQAVKKLAVTDFFAGLVEFKDSTDLTKAELEAGVAALKAMRGEKKVA